MHSYWPVYVLVVVAAFILGSIRWLGNVMGWIDSMEVG